MTEKESIKSNKSLKIDNKLKMVLLFSTDKSVVAVGYVFNAKFVNSIPLQYEKAK